jgi:hypothetical protein
MCCGIIQFVRDLQRATPLHRSLTLKLKWIGVGLLLRHLNVSCRLAQLFLEGLALRRLGVGLLVCRNAFNARSFGDV